jgi:hypothetical protein
MNVYRKAIRIWLAIASFIGFIAGWVFLSHTVETKTVTYVGNTAVEMPALQAIPTVQGLNTNSSVNNVQTFTLNTKSQSLFAPSMRTGGS